jgi:hypothetical protein
LGPPASAPYSDEPYHRIGIRRGSGLSLRYARGRGTHRCDGGSLLGNVGGRPCSSSDCDESGCWFSVLAAPRNFLRSSFSPSAHLPFSLAAARTRSSSECTTACRMCSQQLLHIAVQLHGDGTRGGRYMPPGPLVCAEQSYCPFGAVDSELPSQHCSC